MNDHLNILIVEDSITQAEQLSSILEQSGYIVSMAHNGTEALERVKKHTPAIIISDIMMPEMDGYELCLNLKADSKLKSIPVILLTSLSDPVDVIKGLQCGADNFITKPYNENFLLSRIRHIIINRELRKSGSAEMGIEVFFAGEKHFLTSERIQIIDLLLSTYENAVEKQQQLEQANKDLKKAFETIKVLEANYRALLESNADAIVVVDCGGSVRFVNPAAETLFNRNAANFIGRMFDFPISVGLKKEVTIQRQSGKTLVAEMRVAETVWEGKKALLASLRDVTENVELRDKLRSLSLTDELTGLYNRRGFLTLARQQLRMAKRNKEELLLLYSDMDGMKWINDNLGHHEGDRAIIDMANILRETFRESDIIARIGGDEFVIIVVGARKDSDQILVRRLQDTLDAHNSRNNRRYRLSASVGIARHNTEDSYSIDDLLSQADRLMYQQKKDKCGR